MKALHRILVTGTIGGIAIVTAASSGAFACTAQAGVRPASRSMSEIVAPGGLMSLTIDNYLPEGPGVSLVRVVLVAPDKTETFITERAGPTFNVEWTVPLTTPTSSTSRYAVVATQNQYGVPHRPEGMMIYIAHGAVTPTTRATTTTSPGSSPSSSLVPVPQKDQNPQPVAAPIGQGIGGAKDMTPFFTNTPPAASGGAAVIDPVSGAVVGTPSSAIDGAGPPPQDRQAPALATVTQLPADSLWSGLDGDGGASASLLDVAPPRNGSGSLGGILLGGGAALLALAGVALGVSRRRLALARR